ncbi:mRNA N(3)-methylcytidine methyltransferase METTL8 isoform X1 [Callorhinchus milii]|uniref:mRNA N(3)-methylcytidine methyltransferase METTL8 isoform X1 n=1 Tax=Callorhinchus milii TaxID=7868 RepID=UPI001C3FD219|nr:mRNA N(3)-methylcytidine methyltransferase METTL8 isoform X1 [Callorhinchus milii]XP_007888139.2 mRNA N(3)-methylcytidine methyltransferase METTL8 isoform X1 [Callorhinchus milii]XP_007888140.2 mRNA N(3)-methylcytidine methyltransferase METTL8 isoform X1 [Callorhinchus milii]XP_007888141.2 mRNA N(3)-methylcytidine methyltransferase METTL8 isoform X1 [Callorhinchus milii]XP_007888142.2 mRNA N(3)-methylcytidine methyltransferase METTL8 isoform X1 [Callorhinchus milii]XP_007888143.2 mRNA N(3)-
MMKRQMIFVHSVSVAWLRNLRCQCRFQSRSRPVAPLGSRILSDPSRVFEHNMWDHIQWTPEQEELARQKAEENSRVKVSLEEQVKYEKDASKYWDGFYRTHQSKFFKDRTWLFREFPELLPDGILARNGAKKAAIIPKFNSHSSSQTQSSTISKGAKCDCFSSTQTEQILSDVVSTNSTECTKPVYDITVTAHEEQSCNNLGKHKNLGVFPGFGPGFRIFEVGCGAGNSVFPILAEMRHSDGFLYCCDFSPYAVDLVKSHPSYNAVHCNAFVHDVCDETDTYPFPDESIDVILLVFVLSSIHPERMPEVVKRLSKLLKPGGMILFRDYGRYDMSQLRLKKGRCLDGNFYVRGDGTRVYYFTKEEIANIFISAGLKEVQNLVDRRLQVNRKKKIAMHRIWIQSKYQKEP